MKICSRCNLEKSIGDFNIRNASKDGLQPHCSDCDKARIRQHEYPNLEERTCNKCGETSITDEGFYKDSRGRKGYRPHCKKCEVAKNKRTRERNPELYRRLYRNRNLISYYGITLDEWGILLVSQDSCCAICGNDNPKENYGWQTDHDHRTGKVRGILCHFCNIAVGHVENGWALEVPAITKYLEDHHALANCEQGRGEALLCS